MIATFAEAIAETGGSFQFGGRYNPKGVFGGLYASESDSLAWLEIVKYYQGRLDIIPDHVLGKFNVRIAKTLDLTSPDLLRALDVERSDITDPTDWRVTQLLGHAAWMLGIEAIRYPSSPAPDRSNIVIFVDQLGRESKVTKTYLQPYRPS